MTDIVERLRDQGLVLSYKERKEAADEIERLTRRLALAETSIECFESDRIDREAENERLRAALRHAAARLSDLEYHWLGTDADLWGPIRAVLADEQKGQSVADEPTPELGGDLSSGYVNILDPEKPPF